MITQYRDVIVIILLFIAWVAANVLHESKSLTTEEAKKRSNIFTSAVALNFIIVSLIVILVIAINKYIPEFKMHGYTLLFALLFLINYLLGSKIENYRLYSKEILAKPLTSFSNLSVRKKLNFKEKIDEDYDIDVDYYRYRNVLISVDYTVDRIEFNRLFNLEYKMFQDEIKKDKPSKLSAAQKMLVDYYNRVDTVYALPKIEELEGKTRIEIETRIVEAFKILVSKNLPIRISQLLQIAKDARETGFIYFLMGLEARRFVPLGAIYARYFAEQGMIK